jgi:hypothetical protein
MCRKLNSCSAATVLFIRVQALLGPVRAMASATSTETLDSFAPRYGNVVVLCGQFSDFLKDGGVRFLSKIGDLSTLGTRDSIDAVQSTDYFFRSVTAIA